MTPQAIDFDLGAASVRVNTTEIGTIPSLKEFFEPYIPAITRRNDSYELNTVTDTQLYDAITRRLPDTPQAELTTSLQHDVEYKLKCFNSDRDLIIEDEPLRVLYQVSEKRRQTRLIASVGSRVRTALLRIVRAAWLLGQPGLIVHGCVLEKNGRGIVISGDKYAGKTTSLLNLCLKKGYDVVANDRLLLTESGWAKGVPTVVKLRSRTLEPFPELDHLKDVEIFGVQDLARALGVKVKQATKVTAFVFLNYDESAREPLFSKLSFDERRDLLNSQVFPRRDYEWVRVMGIGSVVRDSTTGNVLDDIACFGLSCNETHLERVSRLLDGWCQSP